MSTAEASCGSADIIPSLQSPLLPSCGGEGWELLLSDASEEERFWRMEIPAGRALLRLFVWFVFVAEKYPELFPELPSSAGWRKVEATELQPQVGLSVSLLSSSSLWSSGRSPQLGTSKSIADLRVSQLPVSTCIQNKSRNLTGLLKSSFGCLYDVEGHLFQIKNMMLIYIIIHYS